MGWRVDQAYDEAQKKDFREWKASLSWPEYWSWRFRMWGPFICGVIASAALVATIAWIL